LMRKIPHFYFKDISFRCLTSMSPELISEGFQETNIINGITNFAFILIF
jgi:hypothetical protein